MTAAGITSAKDPRLEAWVERSRGDGDLVVVDGPKLVREALDAGITAEVLLLGELDDPAHAELSRLAGPIPVLPIEGRLERKLTDTTSPRGAVLLARKPREAPLPPPAAGEFLLVLDGVQDPGNAGALVRAAYAYGAVAILFGEGSARPFSPKVVRASAGTILRIPVTGATPVEVEAAGFRPVLLDGATERSIEDPLPEGALALVVGSEGRGLSGAWSGERRRIDTARNVESLAALSAASIALAELHRQRRG